MKRSISLDNRKCIGQSNLSKVNASIVNEDFCKQSGNFKVDSLSLDITMDTSISMMGSSKINQVEELIIVGDATLLESDNFIMRNKQAFETIKENYRAVNRMIKQLRDEAKQSLEALMEDHKKVEETAIKEAKVQETLKQEQQLCQELELVKQNQAELSTKCKTLSEQHEMLLKQKQRLEEEIERLANETTINIPVRREELALYNSITQIRWDFDGPEHSAKGYVCNQDDVKPFSFDGKKCSQYFITNSLWDSMKES